MKKFPKKIYVNWVNENDPYMEVNTKVEFLDQYDDQVAIYQLLEVKTLKVTRELK